MNRYLRLPKTGQSLVEFALIIPLLLTIFFGIIELGVLFSVYVGLTNSAREGARAGSTYEYQCPPPPAPPNCKANNLDLQDDVREGRRVAIEQAVDATLNPLIDSAVITPTITYTPANGSNIYSFGDKLEVAVSYQHQLFFDLLGGPTLNLQARSTMRVEPGGR